MPDGPFRPRKASPHKKRIGVRRVYVSPVCVRVHVHTRVRGKSDSSERDVRDGAPALGPEPTSRRCPQGPPVQAPARPRVRVALAAGCGQPRLSLRPAARCPRGKARHGDHPAKAPLPGAGGGRAVGTGEHTWFGGVTDTVQVIFSKLF